MRMGAREIEGLREQESKRAIMQADREASIAHIMLTGA